MALMRQSEGILARNPNHLDALLTMASLVAAAGSATKAVPYLQKAHAIRKKDPDILRRLLSAVTEARDFAAAKKYARKLCDLEPNNPENHRALGEALERAGSPLVAVEHYKRALKLQPDSAMILYDIGRMYSSSGDEKQALAWYERSAMADPKFSWPLYTIANAKKFTTRQEADEFVAKAEHSLQFTQEAVDKGGLAYAAGKAYDDIGEADLAFPWFAKANEWRRPARGCFTPPFARNAEQAFDRPFFLNRKDFGDPSHRPIFVLGMPRSGTTLVESLAGAHSQVTAGDEQVFMTSYSQHLGRDSNVEGAYARNVHNLTRADVADLAQDYLKRFQPIVGDAPRFTDKLPHNFVNVGFIHLLFPNAKIVHCRRHPLDNCFSLFSNSMIAFHNDYKCELTNLGLYYRQYLRVMEHWRQVLPGLMHEVFYEDIVANTELNARAMIGYLGLPWEDGVMDRTRSQRSVRTLSNWQVRQPVYQTSKGRWRAYEKHLGALIDALGPAVEAYERELAALGERKEG
jgi:tetratricopeptide (TPR) repeat protein